MDRSTSQQNSPDTKLYSSLASFVTSIIPWLRDSNSSANKPPSSSTSHTTSDTPSSRDPISTPSSPEISPQQNTTRMVPLQVDAIVERTLLQPTNGFRESTFIRVHLNDVLIWNLVKLNLEKLHLQNCTFDPNGHFVSILKFLKCRHPSKSCFRFAIQFNGFVTHCTLSDEFSGQEFTENEHIDSLILILSDDPIQKPSLDGVSSLVLLPLDFNSMKLESSQSKQIFRSMMDRLCPSLKLLLLAGIDLDGYIESYIPIPQLKLDWIYLWDCYYKTLDPLLYVLLNSMKLLKSLPGGESQKFQFTIRTSGHTTQIVCLDGSLSSMPISSYLIHGLILPLGQELPNDLSLDDVSFIAFFSSEKYFKMPFSSPEKTLKSIMNRRYPDLKYLLFYDTQFDGNIEDYISISQLKLNLIYISENSNFKTNDVTWSALYDSMELFNSLHEEELRSFQFAIPINGHTTQILIHRCEEFSVPNSPDLLHGLILHLGQNIPDDLLLVNTSFLVFLPSESDPGNLLSSQPKQYLESIKSRCHKLECLFSKGVSFDGVEGMADLSRQQGGLKAYTFLLYNFNNLGVNDRI